MGFTKRASALQCGKYPWDYFGDRAGCRQHAQGGEGVGAVVKSLQERMWVSFWEAFVWLLPSVCFLSLKLHTLGFLCCAPERCPGAVGPKATDSGPGMRDVHSECNIQRQSVPWLLAVRCTAAPGEAFGHQERLSHLSWNSRLPMLLPACCLTPLPAIPLEERRKVTWQAQSLDGRASRDPRFPMDGKHATGGFGRPFSREVVPPCPQHRPPLRSPSRESRPGLKERVSSAAAQS